MKGLNKKLFGNIGTKIKLVAKVLFWLGTIVSVLMAILYFVEALDSYFYAGEFLLIAVLWLVGGPVISWISSISTYGFGELIVQVTDIKDKLCLQQETAEPQVPATSATAEAETPEQAPEAAPIDTIKSAD